MKYSYVWLFNGIYKCMVMMMLDIILDIYGLFLVRFMIISGLFRFLFNFVKYLIVDVRKSSVV